MVKKKKDEEEEVTVAAEASEDAATEADSKPEDEPKEAKHKGADIITVRSTLKGNKVALWEENPEHPDGEVYIAGPEPIQVARTSEVAMRLRSGVLVEVGKGDGEVPEAEAAKKTK